MAKIYVAITGGIGSGKSLVLQFLREMKFPVFSCDELYKQVIVSKEYIEKIGYDKFLSQCNLGVVDMIISENKNTLTYTFTNENINQTDYVFKFKEEKSI